jgi:hypothetical protein
MTRVVTGVVVAWTMMLAPAAARAAEPKIATVRDSDRATITLRMGALTVTETLTRTAVSLRLVHEDDSVRFAGDLDGQVVVERGGTSRHLSLRRAEADDYAAINALLAGSSALRAFDTLLQSAWARSSESAALFKSTREVIRVLQGEPLAKVGAAAITPVAAPAASLVPVRQRPSPSQCWDTYARDVIHFTYELQSCLNSASYQWWNPLATAWCAYEYNLKSSLASIWLLDCFGVSS